MSLFFLLNNLHFFLEILGALVFLIVAWLAFDAFIIRKNFLTASRMIGFLLLAVWQIIHALHSSSDVLNFVAYAFCFGGIGFVLFNIAKEAAVERPEFKAVLFLPPLVALQQPFDVAIAIGFFLITLVSFRQYKRELKKSLMPFWIGFLFLSLGALASVFYTQDSLSAVWAIGHLLGLIGFFALAAWVWSYLQLRIREELLLVFISFALLMAVTVSLTFSTILISRIETQTKNSLLTDVKVLDLAILRLQEEALAKTRLLASRTDIKKNLEENNFLQLEKIANELLQEEKLGFLIVLDKEGYVVLRAHALTKKEDNLSNERAVAKALEGESFVTIEASPVEKFSIRAASPIMKNGEMIGAIVAGFPLDNVLADSIKRITGLEVSIFENNIRVATTAFNPDGKTRSVGIKQTDVLVTQTVLEKGQDITLSTTILSRPYLASYLPIRNTEGNIVGMISAAKPQQEILETANTTNRLTLIVVVIIMLTLTLPIYFITRRLSEEIK